jgi:heme exporter protein D
VIETFNQPGAVASFFAMGGYGFYVWTSYAIFALVLLWDGLLPRLRTRHLLRDIARRQQRDKARRTP